MPHELWRSGGRDVPAGGWFELFSDNPANHAFHKRRNRIDTELCCTSLLRRR